MPLESATFLHDLVPANPAHTDGLSQADSHMRLIKQVLQGQFPNFTSAALNSTQAQIDAVAALLVGGQLTGNGAVTPGFIMDFGGTTAPTGWVECNGGTLSRTVNAALFAAIGTTWGAGDGSTTFNVPPDRYRRGRNAAGVAVGTLQASQNLTHTHTGSGTTSGVSVDHTHAQGGTFATGTDSPDHTHGFTAGQGGATTGGGGFACGGPSGNSNTAGASARHAHTVTISGQTGGISADHSHTYSFTTSGGSADGAEARPVSATFLTCIKT